MMQNLPTESAPPASEPMPPASSALPPPLQAGADPVRSIGWQPIETAPGNALVVVGWLDDEDEDHPERHDFDYKEDDCWVHHEDRYQEFCCVAPPGSSGNPGATAPYTHWLEVPPIPRKHK